MNLRVRRLVEIIRYQVDDLNLQPQNSPATIAAKEMAKRIAIDVANHLSKLDDYFNRENFLIDCGFKPE